MRLRWYEGCSDYAALAYMRLLYCGFLTLDEGIFNSYVHKGAIQANDEATMRTEL